MSGGSEMLRSRFSPRAAVLALVSVGVAACSGDTTRFNDYPFASSYANWSWDGGTAITVAAGETIDTIARRYGVPASVIMQANNITAPATLYPGQRLVIPRYKPSQVATAPIR